MRFHGLKINLGKMRILQTMAIDFITLSAIENRVGLAHHTPIMHLIRMLACLPKAPERLH